MKRNIISLTFLSCLVSIFLFSCKEEFYTIDKDFYVDKEIEVRNPLENNTLRIEQYNTDQIMLIEPNHPDIVFDNRGFVFAVEDESIVIVQEDGSIQPVSKGVTKVDITFRSDARLATSIFIEVYKDYHAVERILVTSFTKNQLIEKGFTLDIAPEILIFPGHADNKLLHYSLDEASKTFASITEDGVITGIEPGIIQVHIVSDDNPDVTVDFEMTVVNEILITDVTLHTKLNNVTLKLGERVDLNKVTGVLPSNVNVVNRNLTFELLEGAGVVTIDPETNVLTAVSGGSARIKVTSKNDISKEFAINVDAAKKDLTPAFWEVHSTIVYSNGSDYVLDGTTGKPEDMFDENTGTFLSLTKPGKTYNNCVTPAGYPLGFTIDMQQPCEFNSFRWNHRTSNSYVYLRVFAVTVEGSDDGEEWETIVTEQPIPNTYEVSAVNRDAAIQDPLRHDIALPGTFEYRYVRVIYTNWSDNSGGSTSGSTLQVAEFGLSYF